MTPRPYQTQCVEATELAFVTHDRVLDVLPTGAGKTIIFSWLAKRWAAKGQRTLILAHREELIDQAIAKLHDATGIVAEKEKAEFRASLRAPVVVASVQSMIRRLDKWPQDHFGLVVADEAHHAVSPSWQTVLRHFKAKVLGVTATPERGDDINLGGFFQKTAYEARLITAPGVEPQGLINQGYLAPIVRQFVPIRIDLGSCPVEMDAQSGGNDFSKNAVAAAIEPLLGKIAEAIRDKAAFRRTLAFLPLRVTSQKFVEACNAAGLRAAHIDGDSPDRKELLARFRNFEFDVLSNAMLLTEGFDDPGIDCIVPLRLTRSSALYWQIIGRGTRLCEGKQNLMVFDFLSLHKQHGIIRPTHLIARDDIDVEVMSVTYDSPAMPADVADEQPKDLFEIASSVTSDQRELAMVKRAEKLKQEKEQFVSAEEFAAQHHLARPADYQAKMPWEAAPPTKEQIAFLEKVRVDATGGIYTKYAPDGTKPLDVSTITTKGHAAEVMKVCRDSRNAGISWASNESWTYMRRRGYRGPRPTTGDARRFHAELRSGKRERAA